jgi:hypothetical protein
LQLPPDRQLPSAGYIPIRRDGFASDDFALFCAGGMAKSSEAKSSEFGEHLPTGVNSFAARKE